MNIWQKSFKREISFSHSLMIILIFFFVSTLIIYYTTVSGQVIVNNYSYVIITKKNQFSSDNQKIIVTRPQPDSLINRNFILAGRVKDSKERIYYQLSDDLDEILVQGNIITNHQQPIASFFTEVNLEQFPANLRPTGKVVIFTINPIEETKENLIIIPVKFNF